MTTAREPAAAVALVRHAESTWNHDGRWQGQADPPLSELGEAQARAGAAGAAEFDTIWSSDLARARRTAELLAAGRTPVQVDVRFRERDVGAWSGLTHAEIEARDPGFLRDGLRPPGWEADPVVAARALAAARDVVAGGGAPLVVTHGGLIRAVEVTLGGAPHSIPHLTGVWLRRVGDGFELGAPVHLLGRDRELEPPVTAE